MLNLPSIRLDRFSRSIEGAALSRSETIIYWAIVLTPLWWLLGIQTLFYPAVMIGLLAVHVRLDKLLRVRLPLCVWAWLMMSIAMAWTAILGLYDMGAGLQTFLAAVVTFMKSYFLIFACLALPFWSQVRVQVMTRAIAWMAAGYLGTIAVQLALLTVGITGRFAAPLARLLPVEKGSLEIILASHSSFLGLPLPRTVLYTPDPPILGLCSIFCFLICLGETNTRLRNLALVGSVVALVLSASRSALVGLPLALMIGFCFSFDIFRQISLWLTSLTFLLGSIWGLTLEDLAQKPIQMFEQARAGGADSSAERALVVRETLEAWQESPWIGWGVIRGAAHLYEDVYISLGSFSTYAAVLYLHGIVGFVALIGAMASTLWAVYQPATQGDSPCRWAFAGLLVLYALCQATPLSWMAVYLWFFFAWLGAALAEAQAKQASQIDWVQLCKQVT